jgi:hypothetical protein
MLVYIRLLTNLNITALLHHCLVLVKVQRGEAIIGDD